MTILNVNGFALITGAASGIGRSTALAFARAGVSGVHITDRQLEKLEETKQTATSVATNPNFRILSSLVDVSKEDEVVRMVKDTAKAFGRIDYAANVAGLAAAPSANIFDHPMSEYDRVNNINARGVYLCMREQLRVMATQNVVAPTAEPSSRPPVRGAIVNVSSILGLRAITGMPEYITSKHAIIGMTKAAALDHAKDLIRVNAVCPGWTVTPLVTDKEIVETFEGHVRGLPFKRAASPDEIADAIVFLASDHASYVSGASLAVDGGLSGM